MNDLTNTVDKIGDNELIRQIVSGEISEIASSHVTMIGAGVFCDTNLEDFYFPKVTQIRAIAFEKTKLTKLDKETMLKPNSNLTISPGAFMNCYYLKNVNLCSSTNASSTGDVSYLGMGSFAYCPSLREIKVSLINKNITMASGDLTPFFQSGRIADINYSYSTWSYSYIQGLFQASTLEIIKMNFKYAITLTTGSTDNLRPFKNTRHLKALVLTSDSNNMISLGESPSNTFTYSPIYDKGCSSYNEAFIYVPDDLVEDYKSATNWSIIAEKIKPISEFSETFAYNSDYIQDDWETIKDNIIRGNYSQYLGKKKYIDIGKFGFGYLRCVGIDTDIKTNGNGFAETSWIFENNIQIVSLSLTENRYGGNRNFVYYTYAQNIINNLHLELNEINDMIVQVDKKCYYGWTDENYNIQSCYCWLPAIKELNTSGSQSTSVERDMSPYDYYINIEEPYRPTIMVSRGNISNNDDIPVITRSFTQEHNRCFGVYQSGKTDQITTGLGAITFGVCLGTSGID